METNTIPVTPLPNAIPVQTPNTPVLPTPSTAQHSFQSVPQVTTISSATFTKTPVITTHPVVTFMSTAPSLTVEQPLAIDTNQSMNDIQKIQVSMEDQQKKIDAMYTTLEKIRKHNVVTMWLTIIFVVLPIVLSVFALPYLMKSYMGALGGGDSTSSPLDVASILKQVQDVKAGQTGEVVTPDQVVR